MYEYFMSYEVRLYTDIFLCVWKCENKRMKHVVALCWTNFKLISISTWCPLCNRQSIVDHWSLQWSDDHWSLIIYHWRINIVLVQIHTYEELMMHMGLCITQSLFRREYDRKLVQVARTQKINTNSIKCDRAHAVLVNSFF